MQKKIDNLLLNVPESIESTIRMMEQCGASEDQIKEVVGNEFDMVLLEMTLGYWRVLYDSSGDRAIYLEKSESREYTDKNNINTNAEGPQIDMDLLPENFKFPAYGIMLVNFNFESKDQNLVTSPYGQFPRNILGMDEIHYELDNYYCFNLFGEGIKQEMITPMFTLEDDFSEGDLDAAREKLPRLDFVPNDEDSRVVPLTEDDYLKINNIFADVEAGIYRPPGEAI